MPLRDIFLVTAIAVIVLAALRKPQIGLLGWLWLSIMNPHRLTYGFAYSMPVLDVLVAATVLSCIFVWKDRPKAEYHPIFKLLLVFYVWCTLTTIFSVDFFLSLTDWVTFSKNLLLVFLMMSFMNKKHWILAGVAIFVLSIAFYGVKGGIFTVRGGGADRVWGPEGTGWHDNNNVSLAMLMLIPITLAFARNFDRIPLKIATYGSALLCFVTILGTQSRGGLVGLLAMLGSVVLRSRQKLLAFIFVPILLGAGFLFMPQSWHDRMATILDFETASTTRLIQWEYAIDISLERPFFGNGFDAFFYRPYYLKYVAHKDKNRSVHSVYFQVLGEHGYIGLAMYLSMLTMLVVCSKRYSLLCKDRKDLLWASSIIGAIQFSVIGFAANGLTINVAYLDLIYYLLVFEVLLISQIRKELGLTNVAIGRVKAFRSMA